MQVRHVFGSEELYLVSESDGHSARQMSGEVSGEVSVDDVDAEDDGEGSDVPMTQSLLNLLAAHDKKKAKKRKKKSSEKTTARDIGRRG